MRFVFETRDDPDLDGLKDQVERALVTDLKGEFPELLWYDDGIWQGHERWKRTKRLPRGGLVQPEDVRKRLLALRRNRSPGLPLRVEPLFEGADSVKKAFGLTKYVLVTLPVFERAFLRRLKKQRGALFDIAYVLRDVTDAVSVWPDIRYSNYYPTLESYQLLSGGELWSCKNPPNDRAWHLRNVNATTLPGGVDGSGYTIGHPDTGWTQHPNSDSYIRVLGRPRKRTRPRTRFRARTSTSRKTGTRFRTRMMLMNPSSKVKASS